MKDVRPVLIYYWILIPHYYKHSMPKKVSYPYKSQVDY